MKRLFRLISGIAASLLLTVGLHAAAERLDPMGHTADLGKPDISTDDPGKVSNLPCASCTGGNNDD